MRRKLDPRLRLRERAGRESRWVIVDGRKEIDTGFGAGDREKAAERLGDYYATNRKIDTSSSNPAQISCADVIALYLKHKPEPPGCYHGIPLVEFWGLKTLREVNGQTCRAYAAERGQKVTASTVRRELGTFQAAINHWHVESSLSAVPTVWKPDEGAPRERVLTRQEVARLLWAARAIKRPDVARFILIAIYTGTRHATIDRLRWYPSGDAGWLDWQAGIIYRAGTAEKQTRKRRRASRMPDRLLAHVRRWAAMDLSRGPQMAVVRYNGRGIGRQQRGWDAVAKAAKLEGVTPHVLKHTCTTWLLRSGLDLWDVAGLTGTSAKTLEATYGHHSPEFQQETAKAFRRKA